MINSFRLFIAIVIRSSAHTAGANCGGVAVTSQRENVKPSTITGFCSGGSKALRRDGARYELSSVNMILSALVLRHSKNSD